MTPIFRYGKRKARQAMALGELERSVMDALWESGPISGKSLFDLIGKKKKIRHNTLLTVLERLIGKGLAAKKKDGRNNVYYAKLSREEFAKEVASPIIEELLDVSSGVLMSALVESAVRDPDKLEELKRLIRDAEKIKKNNE